MAAWSDMQTANNTQAASWGGSIDLASLPTWSHSLVAQNVLFMRTFLAANPETLDSTGKVDLSATGTNPLMIPQDITAALNNAGSTSSAASTSAAGSSSASSTPASSSAAAASSPAVNGASSMASPKILVGLMVAIATIFVL